MRARLPMMIQDPEISTTDVGAVLVEGWTKLDQDHFLDGPIAPRVAVIDLDPDTEELRAPAKYLLPTGNQTLSRYDVDRDDVESLPFNAVSVFATVWRTIHLYEQKLALGREIRWGFEAPQLLVVPRAGWMPNAYYERSSHSLQFFSFAEGDRTVHTSLSRDIVSHETAHALIDGINPDLYDALDPQSLALHEGIADITAMLLAFDSSRLTRAILDETKGKISKSNAFSSIGEQFGNAIDPAHRPGYLRNLLNEEAIDPNHEEIEPHALSQVISGVLYELMVEMHEHFKDEYAPRFGGNRISASGMALAVAAKLFQRIVLRGLDYLPPGEVTFADFGRAIIAADQASPGDGRWRTSLSRKFVERRIVPDESAMVVETNFPNEAIQGANLRGLADSEWVAYKFADVNRDLLGIPEDAEFEVLKRVRVDGRVKSPDVHADQAPKVSVGADGDQGDQTGAEVDADQDDEDDGGIPFRELLFKVRWSQVEPNPDGFDPRERRVQTGTTLVIDWNNKQIRALLRPRNFPERKAARDAMLTDLVSLGIVEITAPETRARRGPSATGIDAVDTDGILRVKQTARLLHIVKDLDE
jgi:hypothetical protein